MIPVETISADIRDKQNTSDHTYQCIRAALVNLEDEVVLSVKGGTWNLMNMCLSKTDNQRRYGKPYNNNPWDHTETPEEYLDRKERQLKKIIGLIRLGAVEDFFFLQEVDCLMPPDAHLLPYAHQKRFWDLLNAFKDELIPLNWGMVSNRHGNKPLITLYNTKTLLPNSASDKDVLTQGKGMGFECEFTHLKTRKTVTLTNVHLDYSADYTQTLPAYQHAQTQANKFTIVGGDTNHTPGKKIVGLITNGYHATNLGSTADGKVTNYDQGVLRELDGFLVNPDQQNRALVSLTEGAVFQYNDSQFRVVEFNPARIVSSERGKPYEPYVKAPLQQPAIEPFQHSEHGTRPTDPLLSNREAPHHETRGAATKLGIFTRKNANKKFIQALDSTLSDVDQFLTWLRDFYCEQYLVQQGPKGTSKKLFILKIIDEINTNKMNYPTIQDCLNARSTAHTDKNLEALIKSHRRKLHPKESWGWKTIRETFLEKSASQEKRAPKNN